MKWKFLKYFLSMSAAVIAVAALFVSCGEDEPSIDKVDADGIDRVVLVYAVASNNLSGFFQQDKAEMLEGAKSVDLKRNRMMVYSVSKNDDHAVLEEIVYDSQGVPVFQTVKKYDRITWSTDPARLSEVIKDVTTLRKADSYGLIMWSHGGNWGPVPGKAAVSAREIDTYPVSMGYGFNRWFGQDIDNGTAHFGDIIEICGAIPDFTFDFIWFDACYMGSIEVAYQLRDKCEYFIAYPTEVWDQGCPYDDVVPFILRKEPSYVGAADAFFNFYLNHGQFNKRNATIGVFDMLYIDAVAVACRAIYTDEAFTLPDEQSLQIYTRNNLSIPGYDFGQFTLEGIPSDRHPLRQSFAKAMSDFVVIKSITPTDFNYRPFDAAVFSGLSCHYYDGADTETNRYYRQLKWYKRVYE